MEVFELNIAEHRISSLFYKSIPLLPNPRAVRSNAMGGIKLRGTRLLITEDYTLLAVDFAIHKWAALQVAQRVCITRTYIMYAEIKLFYRK